MNNSAYKYYYFDENQTFTTLENYGNNKVPKRGFIEINRLKKLESKTITKIHFFENDVIVYFDGYPHVFVDWKEMIKSGIFDKEIIIFLSIFISSSLDLTKIITL